MNQKVTDRQIIERLEENSLRYATLALQNGAYILISECGCRIFGPFLQTGGESLFWVNPDLHQADAFRALIRSGWNLGGERWWVAPEIQYCVRDRNDYWHTEYIQRDMDPGHWRLEQAEAGRWRLHQDMTLEAFNLASGRKELSMDTLINPVPDPLRLLSEYRRLADGVTYAGYEQTVTLAERRRDDIVSGAWNVIELYPGGDILIPTAPCVESTDYMEPIDEGYQAIRANHVRLRITGNRRYKVGYKAAHVTGRLAYYHPGSSDRAYLLVRSFYSDPSSVYPEEPPGVPGRRGDSVHVYNDDGAIGGYGELEVHGRTIGGETGRSASTDTMALWLYVGAAARLRPIARHLLGIEL